MSLSESTEASGSHVSGLIILGREHPKLVVIQDYGSRIAPDLAKGALENAGIQVMIQADTAGGMREHLALTGAGFKILVREEDAAEARDVLTASAEGAGILGEDLETKDDNWPPWRQFC
jgi:putative signal transducing protein